MNKSVTLVSALYQIGRNRWKYSGFPSNYDRYMDRVNGLLQKEQCSPYQGSTTVTHLLWVLVGDYGLEAIQ